MESAFEDPISFIPERWYSRPELIRDKDSFAPFGVGEFPRITPEQVRMLPAIYLTNVIFTGRRACVGKGLALTQIRLVTAKLLSKYKVRFAPGVDPDAVERDMRDQLTAQLGRVDLLFEARN